MSISTSAPNTTPALELANGGETDHGIPLEGKRLQVVQDVMAVGCSSRARLSHGSWVSLYKMADARQCLALWLQTDTRDP